MPQTQVCSYNGGGRSKIESKLRDARGGVMQRKSPAEWAGLCVLRTTLLYMQSLLRRGGLRDIGLERLVGLLGEIGVELAHLGRLRDKALVGRLRLVGPDLN